MVKTPYLCNRKTNKTTKEPAATENSGTKIMKYYTFRLDTIDGSETYELAHDEETRLTTNMRNGKQTTLRVTIDEYLSVLNAKNIQVRETF